MSISTKEYSQMLKRNHMCTRCHQQDAYTLGGRSLCAECARRQRERSAKFRDNHREEYLIKARKAYAQKKRENKCPMCGKKIENNDGSVLCPHCKAKERRRKHTKQLALSVNYPRGENGYCWMCNKNLALPGKRLCQHCRDIVVENLRKGKPSTNANHIWRLKNNNLKGGTYEQRTLKGTP